MCARGLISTRQKNRIGCITRRATLNGAVPIARSVLLPKAWSPPGIHDMRLLSLLCYKDLLVRYSTTLMYFQEAGENSNKPNRTPDYTKAVAGLINFECKLYSTMQQL